MKKTVAVVVLLAVLGVIGWQVYVKWQAIKEKKAGMQRTRGGTGPVAVETAPVRRDTIRDLAQFTGSLYPYSQFQVAPKIPGRLEKLSVNIGDVVQPNQLIAQLDDAEYRQAVEQARADLEVTRANVGDCKSSRDFAQSEFSKVDALKQTGLASGSDWERAKAAWDACEAKYQVAAAQVKQKDAALKAAEVRLSYTQIYAAWQDGPEPRVVGERFVDAGAMLRANDPIVSILDLGRLLAVIHVIERDYPRIQVGQTVSLTTDAYPDRALPGKVIRIAPLLKESSRQARVEIEVPNQERALRPPANSFVRAQIEFASHYNATLIPQGALVRRKGVLGVFVPAEREVDGRKTAVARFVPVKLGITTAELAEILEPPLEGRVITLGQHLLEPDTPILLPDSGGGRTPTKRPAVTTRPPRTATSPARGQSR